MAAKVAGAMPVIRKVPALEFSDQNMKGGHALRKLKKYCDDLYSLNINYQNEMQRLQKSLKDISLKKENLEVELRERNDKIAMLKQKELTDVKILRTSEELEVLLIDETQKRISAEQDVKLANARLEKSKAEIEKLQTVISTRSEVRLNQEKTIAEQTIRLDELELLMKLISQKNEFLAQMEATFREENCSLQKRLRNKENHDMKRSEFEEIATELEEAKNACQLAIRQKKSVQNDLASALKQKQEMADKNKAMENLLARKEKDISDLLTKVNDTINDYELKLERKEEQMWAMSLQMSEESQKNRNHINIDPDFINDIEKKWQGKV
ncbi:hypothetical protein BC829DRAFT_406793 [Chytridium lagenaria]|nr:hypothetical protein BC829DRAFT_406793 [Chytridium lagenaria]